MVLECGRGLARVCAVLEWAWFVVDRILLVRVLRGRHAPQNQSESLFGTLLRELLNPCGGVKRIFNANLILVRMKRGGAQKKRGGVYKNAAIKTSEIYGLRSKLNVGRIKKREKIVGKKLAVVN